MEHSAPSPEKEDEDIHGGDVEVMSEVHLGCPPGFSGPHISHFTISLPLPHDLDHSKQIHSSENEELETSILEFDQDGDLVLPRRRTKANASCDDNSYCVRIQHNITSSIPNVGLQVWRAELVLTDFILHKTLCSSEFHGVTVIELGAGTGLTGLLLARTAKKVFVTGMVSSFKSPATLPISIVSTYTLNMGIILHHGNQILENCVKNVQLNCGLLNNPATVYVRDLDWFDSWPPRARVGEATCTHRYCWTSRDIEDAENASLLLAADVIYSDDLTDAFFSTLERLMSRGSTKVLYMALEKRYNFSFSDLDVVANGYSHFRSYLKDEDAIESFKPASIPNFMGKRMDISQIPQYVKEYERTSDVEIWRIKYCGPKHETSVISG